MLDSQKIILQKLLAPGKGILNAEQSDKENLENWSQLFKINNIDDYISGIILNSNFKKEYAEKIGKNILLGRKVNHSIIFSFLYF